VRRGLALAFLISTVCCASAVSGGVAAPPGKAVAALIRETAAAARYGRELGQDLELLTSVCIEARLARQDPEAQEKKSLVVRTEHLIEEGMENDFEPRFKAGGEYLLVEKQLDAAGDATSGLRRHALHRAGILLEKARHWRLDQVKAIRKVLAATRRGDCDDNGSLKLNYLTIMENAEKFERDAVSTARKENRRPNRAQGARSRSRSRPPTPSRTSRSRHSASTSPERASAPTPARSTRR
jgi:hypothetical protein